MTMKASQWQRLRAGCFRRYQYRCAECARYGKRVQAERAHHAWPVEDYPEYEAEAWNLVALCMPCHDRMHDRTSRQLTALGESWRRRIVPPSDEK